MGRNSRGGGGPRCGETRKAEGESQAPQGERREPERGQRRAGGTRGGRKESGPSHLASPAAAPPRPDRDLRGVPGGGAAPPTALSGQTRARRAKSGLSCRRPALGGRRQLSPPPAPAAPPPAAAPRSLRLRRACLGRPARAIGGPQEPPDHLTLWEQPGWGHPGDKEQPDSVL